MRPLATDQGLAIFLRLITDEERMRLVVYTLEDGSQSLREYVGALFWTHRLYRWVQPWDRGGTSSKIVISEDLLLEVYGGAS